MTQTITRMYDTYQHAASAVGGLKNRGFTDDQISMVAHASDGSHVDTTDTSAGEGAGVGAGVGGALGAGAGLLTGLGLLAIPGVGPVVAAGWLAATAAGAVAGALAGGATGGIVGSLMDNGVTEDDANVYAEGVRRGGALVTVRATDELAPEATRILDSFGPTNPSNLRTAYQKEGWERFDASAPMAPTTDPLRTDALGTDPVRDRVPPRSTAAE